LNLLILIQILFEYFIFINRHIITYMNRRRWRFLPKKEAIAEEIGGQPTSNDADPNFPFEQGNP
jgi:hypothetical protein